MAEASTTPAGATASATPPAFDMAALGKIIGDAVTAAVKPIADSQKAITDGLTAQADAAKAAAAPVKTEESAKGKATEAKPPLTAEDVAKVVADTLTARDKTAAANKDRAAFIADKLKGLPASYAAKLGIDPAKFAAEEQTIRTEFKADMKALGFEVKDVGAGNPGGVTTGTVAPNADQIAQLKASGLTEGEAAYAANVKLPT